MLIPSLLPPHHRHRIAFCHFLFFSPRWLVVSSHVSNRDFSALSYSEDNRGGTHRGDLRLMHDWFDDPHRIKQKSLFWQTTELDQTVSILLFVVVVGWLVKRNQTFTIMVIITAAVIHLPLVDVHQIRGRRSWPYLAFPPNKSATTQVYKVTQHIQHRFVFSSTPICLVHVLRETWRNKSTPPYRASFRPSQNCPTANTKYYLVRTVAGQ